MVDILDYAPGRGVYLGIICRRVQLTDGLHGHDLLWASGVSGHWRLHGRAAAEKGQWLSLCPGADRSAHIRSPGSIRENPERAGFVGVNVQRYQLYAFIVAGAFAGLAGALFMINERSVYPELAFRTRSTQVLRTASASLAGSTMARDAALEPLRQAPEQGPRFLVWLQGPQGSMRAEA